MSKRNKQHKIIEELFKETILCTTPMPLLNSIPLQKESGDHLIEAENAGKQAEAEKYMQHMTNITRLVAELLYEYRKNCSEVKKLRDSLHATEKIVQHHEEALEFLSTELEKNAKHLRKLQKHSNKSKEKF